MIVSKAKRALLVVGLGLLVGCGGNGESPEQGVATAAADRGTSAAAAAISAPTATMTNTDAIVIDNYVLMKDVTVKDNVHRYTYTASVGNWSDADAAITATVTTSDLGITVVQGTLDFGNVRHGHSKRSTNSFTVRVRGHKPFDPSVLTWVVQATALPPTTYELIDQAVANGSIEAETGLVYKIYADFADSRLPAQYVGRQSGSRETGTVGDSSRSSRRCPRPPRTCCARSCCRPMTRRAGINFACPKPRCP